MPPVNDEEKPSPANLSEEQRKEIEKQVREAYITECLKNFRFNPPNPTPADVKFQGIRDLKLLLSMIHHRFTGKPENLRTFLDQTHNAYELCDPDLHPALLAIIFNEIEGEPREKLREHPEIQSYAQLREFLKQHYEPRESFAQAYSKLANAKQEPNETVQQFGDRLTNLSYLAKIASKKEQKNVNEIVTIDGETKIVEKTLGLSPEAATQMIQFLALERFKVGSKLEISRFIRCHPYANDLTRAIKEAIEFETKELQENQLRQQHRGKYCKNCKTSTHWTNECRSKSRPSTSKFCNYCHIPGHMKDECRRRQHDELKKNPPVNASIASISCKYCKAPNHEIKNCEVLAKKKLNNPEKYDRTHPNYKGPIHQEDATKKLDGKNQPNSPTPAKENRRIALCSNKRAIIQMNSPSVNSNIAQLLVDGGADISLIKYESLTEETRQKIDSNVIEVMYDLSDTESRSVGKVPIRVIIEKRIYEFDFHVVKGYGKRIPHDGLLGTDHLDSTHSIINYDTFKLEMKLYNEEFPLFRAYELEPRSRSIFTIETNPTQLTEGIIDISTNDPDIIVPPEINSINNNQTSIVAINLSDETKTLILP